MIRGLIHASAAASGIYWYRGKAYDTLPLEVRVERLEDQRSADLNREAKQLLATPSPSKDEQT